MIIMLTNEFPPKDGGVATYCHGMATAIASLGKPISVVAARKTANDDCSDKSLPIAVYRTKEHVFPLIRHVSRLNALESMTRRQHVVCVWAADWRTGIVGGCVALFHGLPLVVTAHGSELNLARQSPISLRAMRWVFGRARLVLADSRFTRDLVVELGVPMEKTVVVPLGVHLDGWDADPAQVEMIAEQLGVSGRRVVLTLARLTPRKGQDVIIRSMPAVLREVSDAVYVIVGRGHDEPRLRALVAELGLEEHVIFAGFVPDDLKPAFLHLCDVYAMMSRQDGPYVEGFGLSLLEAAACGRPVVAGNHGGVTDAVVDGESGLIVEPTDPGAVASALVRVLTDKAFADEMGRRGRQRVEAEANWERAAHMVLAAIASWT